MGHPFVIDTPGLIATTSLAPNLTLTLGPTRLDTGRRFGCNGSAPVQPFGSDSWCYKLSRMEICFYHINLVSSDRGTPT